MISTLGGEKTRKVMNSQGFDMPKLFEHKADAISFLDKNGLWACHPGLFVSGMVEPKLEVRHGVCVWHARHLRSVFFRRATLLLKSITLVEVRLT